MTEEKFREMVANRTNENIQEKIRKFKDTVVVALRELTGKYYSTDAENIEVLALLGKGNGINITNGWPQFLWGKEQEKVTKDILSTMDTIQRALAAPAPKDTDCKSLELEIDDRPSVADMSNS